MAKVVIALGGNALGDTPVLQAQRAREAAASIADVIVDGNEVVLCHGNGPQVGMINLAFDEASQTLQSVPAMPLAECTALSQGYIGYHLQQGVNAELASRGSKKGCVTVVTEVVVDPGDPAFQHPTKPIGSFVSEVAARVQMAENPGVVFKEDAGRGWREHVASPTPVEIVQGEVVSGLVDAGMVVIACGGGGIPVVKEGLGTRGVSAVIDKDRSAAKLADQLGADSLVILTAVDNVCLNWGTPNQQDLEEVDAASMRTHLEQGHFAEGSMKPKVEAALQFTEGAPDRRASIGSLDRAAEVIAGTSGTHIS